MSWKTSFCIFMFLTSAFARAERIEFVKETLDLVGKDGVKRSVRVHRPIDRDDPNRKFPVLYYFQGWQGKEGEYFYGKLVPEIDLLQMDKVQETLNRLGVSEPAIVVNPLINNPIVDGADGEKHISFIKDELFSREKDWGANEKRSVVGNSLGAVGAISIALTHPNDFEKVFARQPFYIASHPWTEPGRMAVDEYVRKNSEIPMGKDLMEDAVYPAMDLLAAKMPTPEKSKEAFPIDKARKLPKLYLDVGEHDGLLRKETLSLHEKWKEAGPTEFRLREKVGHGDEFTVMGLIDHLVALQHQSKNPPSPLGKLLLELSRKDQLASFVRDIYRGDIITALGQLGASLAEKKITLGAQDLELLKDLAKSISPDPLVVETISKLKSFRIDVNRDGKFSIHLKFDPKDCAIHMLSQRDCKKDRILIPLERRNLWSSLHNLREVRERISTLLEQNSHCEEVVDTMEPRLREVIASIHRALTPFSDGREVNVVQISPEVTLELKSNKGTKTVEVRNVNGIEVLAGLPLGVTAALTDIEYEGSLMRANFSVMGLQDRRVFKLQNKE